MPRFLQEKKDSHVPFSTDSRSRPLDHCTLVLDEGGRKQFEVAVELEWSGILAVPVRTNKSAVAMFLTFRDGKLLRSEVDNANHIHSIRRDFTRDFGGDLVQQFRKRKIPAIPNRDKIAISHLAIPRVHALSNG